MTDDIPAPEQPDPPESSPPTPVPEETLMDRTVTCRTPGCVNEGTSLRLPCAVGVLCSPCGQPITDVITH